VSALSRLTGDPSRRRRYVLEALSTLAFVGMGLGAALTLVGSDLIGALLGPGWEEAGRIFTIFGPGIGVMLLYGTHGWIHLAFGRPDRWVRWGLVELVVATTLFLAGLPWGPAGIAVAWVASYWILMLPALWYAGRPAQLGPAAVVSAVWRYVVASAIAGAVAAVVVDGLPAIAEATGVVGGLARIAVTSVVFGVLYLGAVILLHRSCSPLARVAGLLRVMVVTPTRDLV
jgi:O-antigen/teichoic acid export membrane protein